MKGVLSGTVHLSWEDAYQDGFTENSTGIFQNRKDILCKMELCRMQIYLYGYYRTADILYHGLFSYASMRNVDIVEEVQMHYIGQIMKILHKVYHYWKDLILINRQYLVKFNLSEPKLIARSSD